MRPYMCTPQPVQAWRWMAALASTTLSLSPLRVTCSLSRGTTATCENSTPEGFQHLVQPHTWLCALWLATLTSTGFVAHRHCRVPPAKLGLPGLTPPSTAGWIEICAMACPPRLAEGAFLAPPRMLRIQDIGSHTRDTTRSTCEAPALIQEGSRDHVFSVQCFCADTRPFRRKGKA